MLHTSPLHLYANAIIDMVWHCEITWMTGAPVVHVILHGKQSHDTLKIQDVTWHPEIPRCHMTPWNSKMSHSCSYDLTLPTICIMAIPLHQHATHMERFTKIHWQFIMEAKYHFYKYTHITLSYMGAVMWHPEIPRCHMMHQWAGMTISEPPVLCLLQYITQCQTW
jgi:hypothetical protein